MSENFPQERLQLLTALARLGFDHMSVQLSHCLDSGCVSAGEEALETLSETGLVVLEVGSRFANWTSLGIGFLTKGQREVAEHTSSQVATLEFYAKFRFEEANDRAGLCFNDPRERPIAMGPEVRRLAGAIAGICVQWHEKWSAEHPHGLLIGVATGDAAHGAFEILQKYGLIDVVDGGATWTELGLKVLGD